MTFRLSKIVRRKERTSLHPILDHRMVFFVAIFASPDRVWECGAFEIVGEAVEEVYFVVVDVVWATFLLVQDHSLFKKKDVNEKGVLTKVRLRKSSDRRYVNWQEVQIICLSS